MSPRILEPYTYLAQDLISRRTKIATVDVALREAVDWIYRAQDSTPDRGVSHSYLLGKGWAPSYPETTGYIIPTLLTWSRLSGDAEARQRALEMADWEVEIQLPNGGVMGSVVNGKPTGPVVFNTGQVIFGWLAAYRETREEKYIAAASRAAQWLFQQLNLRETWDSHGSMGEERAHTYNIKVAWALIEFGRVCKDNSCAQRVKPVIEWTLSQERGVGWFDLNCLNDNDRPLLHTIAYTARGLLEVGILLDHQQCIDAARRTVDSLISKLGPDGYLSGRFDRHWNGTVRWSCLTGMAQMSIVLLKLHEIYPQKAYLESACLINQYLRARQRVRTTKLALRGGIPGSFPINGEYGRYRILNWATKYFVDALLLEKYPALRTSDVLFPG